MCSILRKCDMLSHIMLAVKYRDVTFPYHSYTPWSVLEHLSVTVYVYHIFSMCIYLARSATYIHTYTSTCLSIIVYKQLI